MTKLLAVMLAAAALVSQAQIDVAYEWDPSPDPTVTGYRLYVLTNAPGTNWVLAQRIEALGLTNCAATTTNWTSGRTLRAYATAFNAAGLESDPSGSIDYTIPVPPPARFRVKPRMQTASDARGPWLDLFELPEFYFPAEEGQAFFRVKMEAAYR